MLAARTESVRRHSRACHCRSRSGEPADTAARRGFVIHPSGSISMSGQELPVPSQRHSLDGLSIPVKDNIDLAGWPTRAGPLATPTTLAPSDAAVAARLPTAAGGGMM